MAEPVSLVSELNVLLRHRRLLVSIPAVCVAVAVATTYALGREYISESQFAPQATDESLSRFAGLAGQFGIDLGPASNPTESVEFYTELLNSRELLTAVVSSPYRLVGTAGNDSVVRTLRDIYGIRRATQEAAVLAAVEKLRHEIEVSTGLRRAGIITLRTKARWPELAVQINRKLLALVSEFDLRQRQSRAGAERRFVEGRLTEARGELEAAEAALARFLEQNREYQASPRLRFEAERAQRRVDIAQQVYLTLARTYEESRIQEVRDTPVITIIDNPEGSVRRAESLRTRVLMGLLFGVILGVLLAFAREYLGRDQASNPGAYRELRQLIATANPLSKWRRAPASS